MKPSPLNNKEFIRYNWSDAVVKKLPGVARIIKGGAIDIVEFLPPPGGRSGLYIENMVQKLEYPLTEMGIDIYQIAFTYPGNSNPLRKLTREEGGNYRSLTLEEVGIDRIGEIRSDFSADVGHIIPLSLAKAPVYSSIDALIHTTHHLRRLGIDAHDIQIGARFEATTARSKHTLIVGKDGLFHMEDSSNPRMIGKNMIWFLEDGRLYWREWTSTWFVKSMKKL